MYGEGRVARPTRFLSGALSERQSCTIGSRVIRRSNCITTAPDTTTPTQEGSYPKIPLASSVD